jgi:hypothetical protein
MGPARAIVLWMGAFLPGWAWAWEVDAVAVDGVLRPGAVNWVWLAAQDDAGNPLPAPPVVRSADAVVHSLGVSEAPGVWGYGVAPAEGLDRVVLRVEHDGRERGVPLAVGAVPAAGWSVPEHVSADLEDTEVSFLVRGVDLPEPEALHVVSERARLIGVVRTEAGLVVKLAPEPSDDGFPRAWLVALRDTRDTSAPTWVRVSQKARLAVRAAGLEPGSRAWVSVGSRTYGPSEADASGLVAVTVDQYPGEVEGRVRVVDPVGNEATRPTQLPGTFEPRLMGYVAGAREAGEAPPSVYVHAERVTGVPWRRAPPVCRTPRYGELPLVSVSPGTWQIQVPYIAPSAALELRIQCDLDEGPTVSMSLPVAVDVPVDMDLKVWPEELTADFPVADVRVSLQNALGERVPMSGRVELDAVLGSVRMLGTDGPVTRAEYRGGLAAEVGEDTIVARWYRDIGAGPVDRLRVVTTRVPRSGAFVLWVRAEDALRRPLSNRSVRVDVGPSTTTVATGVDGWARVELPVPEGSAPVRIEATAEGRRRMALFVRGTQVRERAPTSADVVREVLLPVSVGRIAEVELDVQPRELQPGRGQTATVRARFVDRTGLLAVTAAPKVSTDEGELRPLEPDADGTMRWELVPRPGFRTRTITVTARSEVLDVEATAAVQLRSPAANGSVGVSAGLQSNFGPLLSPHLSFLGDFRIKFGRENGEPLGPSRFFVRGSLAWYAASGTTTAGAFEAGKRTNLLPLSVVLMLRQEYPAQAFWIGLGGQIVPYWGSTSFDGEIVGRGGGLLPPALVAVLGYGVRVPGGEFVLDVTGSSLTSPGDTYAVSGFVGGVAISLGYRLVF